MDITATAVLEELEALNPFEGLTFFQQVKDFMRTGYSLALGLALCLTLMVAIGVVYSMYLEAYDKTTLVPRTIEKLRKFMVNKEPLLEAASDGDILTENQKLADELVAWIKKVDELNLEIREVTKKLRLEWVTYKGHIYLFEKYAFSWPDAKAFCEKHKATMTCIDNEAEQFFDFQWPRCIFLSLFRFLFYNIFVIRYRYVNEHFIVQETKEANVQSWVGICYSDSWKCFDGTPAVAEYWVPGEEKQRTKYCVTVERECTDKELCWVPAWYQNLKRVICKRKPDKKWPK